MNLDAGGLEDCDHLLQAAGGHFKQFVGVGKHHPLADVAAGDGGDLVALERLAERLVDPPRAFDARQAGKHRQVLPTPRAVHHEVESVYPQPPVPPHEMGQQVGIGLAHKRDQPESFGPCRRSQRHFCGPAA
jgi:hypothetical protein